MRPATFQAALRWIFSAEAIIPFVLGSLALSVMGNAAFQLLTTWLGSSMQALLGLILGMALVLALAAAVLARVLGRLPDRVDVQKKRPDKRRGLIVLVSNQAACQTAIAWHRPTLEHCWLLHSTETAEMAQALCRELEAQGKQGHLRHVEDVFDPTVCARTVEAVYLALPSGLAPADIILDFTGMTALASIGGVLACMGRQTHLQYTPAQRDPRGHIVRSLDPFEVVLAPALLGSPPAAGPDPGAV